MDSYLDESLAEKIYSKKWHFYVTRKFNWFVENTQILANNPQTLVKYVGFDVSQENYLILNGDEYYTDSETEKCNSVLEKLFQEDNQFFEKLSDKEFKIVEKNGSFKARLINTDFRKLTNQELVKQTLEFQEIYTASFIPAFSRPDDYLELKTKEVLKKQLDISTNLVEKIFSVIATYPQLGELAYTNEPLELLELAREFKNGADISEKLNRHIERYSWMKGPVLIDDINFSRGEYLERINNLITKDLDEGIERILSVRINDEKKYRSLIKKYQIRNQALILCEAVRKFIYLRTSTTEASDSLFYLARQTLLKEIAKRLRLSPRAIVMLSSNEISTALQGNLNGINNLVKNRLDGYSIIWLDNKIMTLFGRRAIDLQEEIALRFKGGGEPSRVAKTVIKGTPASLGKVRGKAKILLDYRDAGKVARGDILVATMTTPDYIVAMEKAAAFVTDEGGVTCHAAIVAREFGVPCIVGTGNATKLIKDGDLIEVDAEKGEVKIIS